METKDILLIAQLINEGAKYIADLSDALSKGKSSEEIKAIIQKHNTLQADLDSQLSLALENEKE